MTGVCIIGRGRAGGSLGTALDQVGWAVGYLRRGDDLTEAGLGVDAVIIAVPDDAIAAVAAEVQPAAGVVVCHMAGSLGLEVLSGHERRAAIHPLLPLPNAQIGRERLLDSAWFATAGDRFAKTCVEALGGRSFTIADEDRGRYHAAAVIASNHLVALIGQAERIGRTCGVPIEALMKLVEATVDNVAALGPAAALTGPVARGDTATIERHLAAIDPDERPAYLAMVGQARRLGAP